MRLQRPSQSVRGGKGRILIPHVTRRQTGYRLTVNKLSR